jgi:hypothetical protein
MKIIFFIFVAAGGAAAFEYPKRVQDSQQSLPSENARV